MPISAAKPFKGRQYSGEVILTAVRWYLRYPLAYEHVAELLAERGLAVDATWTAHMLDKVTFFGSVALTFLTTTCSGHTMTRHTTTCMVIAEF